MSHGANLWRFNTFRIFFFIYIFVLCFVSFECRCCHWQLITVTDSLYAFELGRRKKKTIFSVGSSTLCHSFHFFPPVKQTKSWNARRMLTACRDNKYHKHEKEKNVWFLPHTWLIYHCGGALSDIYQRYSADTYVYLLEIPYYYYLFFSSHIRFWMQHAYMFPMFSKINIRLKLRWTSFTKGTGSLTYFRVQIRITKPKHDFVYKRTRVTSGCGLGIWRWFQGKSIC